MVEDEIDRELLRNGDFQTPETIAADAPDTVISVDMEAGEKKGHTSFSLKDVAQAQQEEFTGKKIGDVITVQINKAFEDEAIQKRILGDLGLSDEEKANATEMEIVMHITKISLLLKAELNEELFKKIYPTKEIKTEAEFREAMKEDVTEYYNRQANEQVGDQIYHYLTEQGKLDFPETFFKRWLVVNGEGKKTAEDAEKEYPDFVKNVQWAFLSNKLCNDYNIDVKANDISDYFRNQLMRYIGGQIDVTKDNSWLDEYVNSSMSDKKQVEEAYVQLRISGLLSTLATQVNATDTPISEHDFTELLHEHHHH
jgi:trigger factor